MIFHIGPTHSQTVGIFFLATPAKGICLATIVEGMLPESFLIRHAIYMQTCAHIELAAWEIVQLAEGFDPSNKNQVERFLKLKQRNYDLADALEKSASLFPNETGINVGNLAQEIKQGLVNRNLAAHGSWYFDQETETLRVEHYWKDHSSKTWMHIAEPITFSLVEVAVEEADAILRKLIKIRKELIEFKENGKQ